MTNRSDLLQQLNRLKRDERELKTEELDIRRVKAARDQREPLAQNHEKRMKNKRKQGLITTELRKLDAPAATIAGPMIGPGIGPGIAPVTESELPLLPPSPLPPDLPPHGDPIEP
jgi:hypothetical protein